MKIINFEKKKMKLLTTKQQKNDKICYISKEKFEDKQAKVKKTLKSQGPVSLYS